MAEWKLNIKSLADGFCISQIKVNRMLKKIENLYEKSVIPGYYKGNRDEYLYDKAQKEIMSMIFT